MTPNHMNYVTMVATEVGAGATFVAACAAAAGAWIAREAAQTWRAGLREQRENDCSIALHACAAQLGAAITQSRYGLPDAIKARSDVWARWTYFLSMYGVLRRYDRTLTGERTRPGNLVLADMERLAIKLGGMSEEEGVSLNTRFGIFIEGLERDLFKTSGIS